MRSSENGRRSPVFRYLPALLLAVTFFLANPAWIFGQTVQGYVTDGRTKFAVTGANVALRDSTGTVVAGVGANHLGAFRITAPGPGVYSLVADAMGYGSTDSGSFELGEGETITIDLFPTPNPVELDTLAVETRRQRIETTLQERGFYDRQRAGFGSFLTPEQIRRWPAITVFDVLEHAPFVHREGNRIVVRKYGTCEPTIYIDENKLQPGVDLGSALTPEELSAVEVYRGTTQIPLQWAGHESCGVILIWTRFGRGVGLPPSRDSLDR